MNISKSDVELYLSDVFAAINAGRYQIANRPKNLPRYGGNEETVSLYIKFNKLTNQYVIVISLHKQEFPLSYKFK